MERTYEVDFIVRYRRSVLVTASSIEAAAEEAEEVVRRNVDPAAAGLEVHWDGDREVKRSDEEGL